MIRGKAGFTLLETMIALGIMMVSFTAIYMTEAGSINTSAKAKQSNIVAMLAKNVMVDTEYKLEGKSFEEVKKEEAGQFETPYEEIRWSRTIKEIKFPTLPVGGGGDAAGKEQDSSSAAEMIAKLLTKFLSKSIREVTVTITWKKGEGEQSYSVSTYWVNLNQPLEMSE